jgi:hypothetical protein
LLPLTTNPLPDQKLETVHDQYTRAKAAKQDFFRPVRGSQAYDMYANQRGNASDLALFHYYSDCSGSVWLKSRAQFVPPSQFQQQRNLLPCAVLGAP